MEQDIRAGARSYCSKSTLSEAPVNANGWQGKSIGFYRATVYPKSVRYLGRYRDKIERDMAAMYSRLSTRKVKHKRMLIAQGTWSDIMEIEERMMQVLIMYSQQQRAGTDGGSASICDYLHQDWFDWVRAAKKRNTDGVAEGSWAGCERQEGLVERTPFHSFGGSQEG